MGVSESIVIVGPGAMGTALAHAFSLAGVRVAAVSGRNAERTQRLAGAIGARPVALSDAGRAGDVIVLAVSDGAIETACEAVDAAGGTLVAHVSGSRTVAALGAAAGRGAVVGALHPLAAVARGARALDRPPESYRSTFAGAAFALEGDARVTERLSALATAIGGRPFAIAAADKPLYHLGASMLAAFAAGLAQVAWDQMRRAGASPEISTAGVSHLLRTVADNIGRAPTPSAAQTGPVARGDAGGVSRQAAVARALSPEAQAVYRVHCEHAVALARRDGTIDDQTAALLLAAIRESGVNRHDERS
jgi:predicted short-subunit dehydrogenase-like oxidoreductase (DUF2520 family)